MWSQSYSSRLQTACLLGVGVLLSKINAFHQFICWLEMCMSHFDRTDSAICNSLFTTMSWVPLIHVIHSQNNMCRGRLALNFNLSWSFAAEYLPVHWLTVFISRRLHWSDRVKVMAAQTDRVMMLSEWENKWQEGKIAFHQPHIHQ